MRTTKDNPHSRPWELLDQSTLNLLDLNSMYACYRVHTHGSMVSPGHWEIRRHQSNQIVATVRDDLTRSVQAWQEAITLEHVQPDW